MVGSEQRLGRGHPATARARPTVRAGCPRWWSTTDTASRSEGQPAIVLTKHGHEHRTALKLDHKP
jgi:hypothetical protein